MPPAIAIDNLTVDYPGRGPGHPRVQALRGLTLQVASGQIYGFLGLNGAGKTTALHVLLGFVAPTSGSARVLGADVRGPIARQRLGYLPEHPDTYRFLTGREWLMAVGRLCGMPRGRLAGRVADLLAQTGLEAAADRLAGTYSRGMLQRLGLAQALINDPDLLILDEPTGGFDPLGRLRIRDLMQEWRRRGKTVFFSSHELSEVERVCDRIGLLAGGRLVADGTLADLVRSGESLEQYFVRMVS